MRVTSPTEEDRAAIARLITIAKGMTGTSARVRNFLLAWWNPWTMGGWNFLSMWMLDEPMRDDILRVLRLAIESRRYPGDFGYGKSVEDLAQLEIEPNQDTERDSSDNRPGIGGLTSLNVLQQEVLYGTVVQQREHAIRQYRDGGTAEHVATAEKQLEVLSELLEKLKGPRSGFSSMR